MSVPDERVIISRGFHGVKASRHNWSAPMKTQFKYLARRNGATEVMDSGMRVIDVLGWYNVGETPEAIAEDFELPIAAVFEALAYAHEYPEEIDAIRARDAAAVAEMKEEWNELLGGRFDELMRGIPVP
ncbi:MAG TPA: DUF433 domain-containing protein [Chloroflexota bacterium]